MAGPTPRSNSTRDTHALGTMALLTHQLAPNTAARRCKVSKIERDHIVGGQITVVSNPLKTMEAEWPPG